MQKTDSEMGCSETGREGDRQTDGKAERTLERERGGTVGYREREWGEGRGGGVGCRKRERERHEGER